MRRLEEQILTEKYRRIEGKLTFSVRLAELSVAPGEAAEGAFTIFASQEEIPAQGYVLTKDERMECKTEWFNGVQEKIVYRFCADGLQEGDSLQGQFHSLDILRLFAALQIAITHYLNLTMLTYGKDGPGDGLLLGFKRALTLFPGLIILFSISGFLMGETLMRTQNRKIFAQKRILRLYPALWVNIVLTIGMLSLLPGVVSGHGKDLLTWAVVQGVGLAYTPSFLQTFAIESINGTLWALMVEIQLYVLVAVVWKRCLAWKDRTWHVLLVLTALLNLACGLLKNSGALPGAAVSLLDRSFLPYLVWFFAGLYLWHFKETILQKLTGKWFILLIVFICYKVCWQTFGWKLPGYYADLVTSLLLPVVVLACAYGWKKHRLKNDLSYGIFLYHWPLINLVFYWNLPKKMHHIPLFLLYVAGFLALACASWFLLERHVLKRKR